MKLKSRNLYNSEDEFSSRDRHRDEVATHLAWLLAEVVRMAKVL